MAWGRVALLLASEPKARTQLEDMAEWLDYAPKPEPLLTQHTKQPHADKQLPLIENTESPPPCFPNSVFWQIKKIIDHEPTQNTPPNYLNDKKIAANYNPNAKGTYTFAAPTPFISLTQLAPLLMNSLGRKVCGQRLDSQKIVRQISQGKPINQLPYQQHSKWPLQLTIIVDKHHELYPYWQDYDGLVKQCQTQLGERNVNIITVHERNIQDVVIPSSKIASSVLLLTDLWDYGNSHRYWAWQSLLGRLQKQATQLLTLSSSRYSPPLNPLLRKARINSLLPNKGTSRHAKKQGFTISLSRTQRDAALTMISPLAMVDSGLLRKLRTHFNWGPVALEGELWNDPKIVQNVMGIRVQESDQEGYRKQFSQLSASIQTEYWAIVDNHHQHAYQGLLALEGVNKMALSHQKDEQTTAYLEALLVHLHQNPQGQQSPLNAQLKSLIDFIPEQAWATSEKLTNLLHQAFKLANQEDISQGKWPDRLPVGFDLKKVQPANPSNPQAYNLQLINFNGRVEVRQSDASATTSLLKYTATKTQPATWQRSVSEKQQPITAGDTLNLKEDETLTINTLKKQWQIQGIICPTFAKNCGQDKHGLFIETVLNTPNKRYYWLPAIEDENHQTLAGTWFPLPQLTDELGRDLYGVYFDLTVKKVTQRFRYIAPGSFLMGSPEDKREWRNNETQHQVTLTDSFWLADTAVTQAFYKAVMGNNPSRFKGDNNPVEKISWNGAKQFIQKVNRLFTGGKVNLPSEAQWEYACRTGTQTPFSFGETITPEQVNYDGEFPYGGGKKGENRRETMAVKSLPANAWGLYEMHGNVWEWCEDSYRENLGREPVLDSIETKLGVYRVLRGGSWFNRGKKCRSAYRDGRTAVDRNARIGFRLSLGLELQPRQKQTGLQQEQSRKDRANEPDGEKDKKTWLEKLKKKLRKDK